MKNNELLREEFRKWWLLDYHWKYSDGVADFWLSKLDSLKAELVGKLEEIGEQQDDDTIWIEMDEAIKIVSEL